MNIVLIIEHDLLPISSCFDVVHASIMGFALDFIEGFAVVRKNAQERGTP
jgi:Ethanolamine utilization protein EutJ (predicted chaperonin)